MISREIIRKDILIDDTDYENLCLAINQHKHFFLSKGMEKGDVVCLNLPNNDGVGYVASYMACLELGLPLFIFDDFLWDITSKHYIHGIAEDMFGRLDRVVLNIKNWTQKFNKNRHFIQHTISDEDINYKKFYHWKKIIDTLGETGSLHSYKSIKDMPDHDVQPWKVYESDIAIVVSYDFDSDEPKFREVSHDTLEHDTENINFPKDEVFGFSISLHHRDVLQNGILPALIHSKRLVYLSTPSISLYGDNVKVFLRRTIRKMKRYGVNAMYSDGPDSMSSLFRLMEDDDFRETVRIIVNGKRTDFHDYWESEKNIIFEFIA